MSPQILDTSCAGSKSNVTIRISHQGIPFSFQCNRQVTKREAPVRPESNLTTFKPKRNKGVPKPPMTTPRTSIRSIGKSHPRAVGIATTAQLSAQLQFLEISVNNNTLNLFRLLYQSLCSGMQHHLQLIQTQIYSNPTLAVRALLQREDIIAVANEEIIEIIPCLKLSKDAYEFTPINDVCYEAIPIAYTLNDQKYSGLFKPLTNEVVADIAPIPCSSFRPIPFVLENSTFVFERNGTLTKITSIHHLPGYALPTINFSNVISPSIFHEVVMYSANSFQPPVTSNDIYRTYRVQSAILEQLGVASTTSDINQASRDFLSELSKRTQMGFLLGFRPTAYQIWTFLVCLFVTLQCIYRALTMIPQVREQLDSRLPWRRRLRPKVVSAVRQKDIVEEVCEPLNKDETSQRLYPILPPIYRQSHSSTDMPRYPLLRLPKAASTSPGQISNLDMSNDELCRLPKLPNCVSAANNPPSHIKVRIKDHVVFALIDTGAAISPNRPRISSTAW